MHLQLTPLACYIYTIILFVLFFSHSFIFQITIVLNYSSIVCFKNNVSSFFRFLLVVDLANKKKKGFVLIALIHESQAPPTEILRTHYSVLTGDWIVLSAGEWFKSFYRYYK